MGLNPATLPDRVKAKIANRSRAKEWQTFDEAEERRVLKLEREDHAQFAGWLERNEYAYAHNRTDKRATTNLGVPDFLIGCRVGLAIEFKRSPAERLSTEQQRWRVRHEARGGIYRVVCSYQAAVAVIEQFGL